MRNLLQATDRDRLVAHLRGPLSREVTVGGQRLTALAEADGPEGGSFCAAPGNARAAELLAQPEIRDSDPAFTDAVLDFVMAMADAPVPCRRVGIGGLELLRDDPRDFEILTPFHRFSGNLADGMVRQHLRGPQEKLPPILHTGNLVEFRIDRHRPCVDVETTIVDCGLRRTGSAIVLMHESRITGRAGWLRPRDVEAGTLRYEYEITAGSPVLRVTVTFTAAVKMSHLRVTTAVDAMDEAGLDLAEAMVGTGAAWRPLGPPKEPGLAIWAENEPVGHLAIGVAGWPEDAPTLHIRPAMPARIMGVKAVAQRAGALHWLLLRHGPVELAAGGTLSVREERLLAVGTRAEAAGRALSGADAAGLDLDPLPPQGAALNAVASFLLFADQYAVPPSADRRKALLGFLARHTSRLLAGTPGVEDLALAVLATEARLRAGEAEAERLGDLAGRLLALQRDDGTFREDEGQVPGLPAQGAALLALARALPHLAAAALAPAIARGLGTMAPGPVEVTGGGPARRVEGVVLAGAGPVPQRRFAEGLGVVARAAGAVVLAAGAVPGALPEETVVKAEELYRQSVALLRPMVKPRGATLEVSPSPFGGAATPAAQAAAGLALMAPDSRILAMAVA